MKLALIVGLIGMVTLVGCKRSETGGMAGDQTFKVGVPATSTDVKQGEVQTARVSVDRSSEFKQKVRLEAKAPKGLDVDPGSIVVQPGDKGDVQLTIKADKDAPLGDYVIVVTGTPDVGDAVKTEFKVTVSAN